MEDNRCQSTHLAHKLRFSAGIQEVPRVRVSFLVGVLTGVEPALEGETAVLEVEGEVVDVKRTGGDHLDGLVVPH